MALHWEHVQGAQIRAQIREALSMAGDAGATSKSIAATIGHAQRNVRWYLSNTEGLALFAGTRSRTLSRWFAPGLDEAAGRYVAECNTRVSKKAPAGPKTLQAIVDAAIDGRTVDDVCLITGNARRTIRKALAALFKEGRVCAATWPAGTPAGGTVRRYWSLEQGAQLPPPKQPRPRTHVSRAKPKELHKRKGPKPNPNAVVTRGPLKPGRRATPYVIAAGKAPQQIIVPANVKRTVCPSGTDTRFTVHKPEAFFSAMTPGSYLRTGSAIERAYGGGA